MEKIKIIIADDSIIYANGLQMLLENADDIDICAVAKNGKEVLTLCEEKNPDVVVMDIQMPVMDGIEAANIIKKEFPGIKIIGLTMFNANNLIVEMIRAGAISYLDKFTAERYLEEAIRNVHKGFYYYCQGTTMRLSKSIESSEIVLQNPGVVLTARELELLKLISKEYTAKEIAAALHLSVKTIETYRNRMQEKMKVRGIAGMILFAVRNKIINI